MAEYDPQYQPDEAMVDLLIKQVTEGLSPAEERALEALDDAAVSDYARDLERATAAVSLAASLHPQTMPPSLQARLQQLGAEHAAQVSQAAGRAANGTVTRLPRANGTAAGAAAPAQPAVRGGSAGYAWFAAAACLVLAAFGWLRTPPERPGSDAVLSQNRAVDGAPVPATGTATAPAEGAAPAPRADKAAAASPPVATAAAFAAERSAMLAQDDTVKFELGRTKDPGAAGVSGDVVWDPHTQRGYLHFSGLAPNDPGVRVYQMWVFDATRDQRYPVDGGMFDIPADATEAVIPIRAAIAVRTLAAIAVTVEKPGGVVVSARQHIVAIGKAG